jgi:isopenicillin N synthase-like dioxygenase
MRRMSDISTLFTSLIAEAIGLPADAFSRFFDKDQQHKLKIVKYPPVDVPDLPTGGYFTILSKQPARPASTERKRRVD